MPESTGAPRATALAEQARSRSAELAVANQALRRTTYASVMRLAQREWDRGSVASARALMNTLRPRPAEDDLRGFDWSFLERQCGASLLTVPVPGRLTDDPHRSVSFSPDGGRLVVTSWDSLSVADA